jgi:protein-disulfide isomerase
MKLAAKGLISSRLDGTIPLKREDTMNTLRSSIIVILWGVVAFGGPLRHARADHDIEPGMTHTISTDSVDRRPTMGASNALVTIRYWISYRSSYNAHATKLLEKLVAKHPGQIRVIAYLRSQSGVDADRVAAIAREIFIQGGNSLFWKFHKKISTVPRPYAVNADIAIATAKKLGIAPRTLQLALKRGMHEEQIYEDTLAALQVGINPSTSSVAGLFNTSLQYISSSTRLRWMERIFKAEKKKALAQLQKGLKRKALASWSLQKAYKNARKRHSRHRRYRRRYTAWRKTLRVLESDSGPLRRYSPPLDDVPIKGSPRAVLTLVLFLDPVDNNSSNVWHVIQRLMNRYKEKIRLAIRFLPRIGYSRSTKICRILLAAAAQKKFWPLTEMALKKRYNFRLHTIKSQRKKLGVDMSKLEMDMKSLAVKKRLAKDIRLAQKLGVFNSPTLFVNGLRLDNLSYNNAATILLNALVRKELRPGLLSRFFKKERK